MPIGQARAPAARKATYAAEDERTNSVFAIARPVLMHLQQLS